MHSLPFVEEILADLRRFAECVEDNNDVNLERSRFDLLVQLGLLERVQRSPARWMMTQAGEDAIAPPAAAHGGITAEVLAPFLAVADSYDPAEDDAYVPAKDWMMDDALRLTLGQFRALKRAAAHGDEAELPERYPCTNGTWGDMGDAYSAGWNDCLDRVAAMRAQGGADRLNRAEPAAPVASNDPALVGALASIVNLSRALRQGGPAPEDLQELSDALEEAVAIAHDAVAGLPDPDAAIRSIVHERQRQIEAEGWTPEHDDQYQNSELCRAAAGYALYAHADQSWKNYHVPNSWPFPAKWFKPADARRMLVKAGALVVAEIQRIDRAAARAQDDREAAK